MLTGAQNK